MNGAKKWHKATGPAFNVGEKWVDSGGNCCWVVSVCKYPQSTNSSNTHDYCVTYRYKDGYQHDKDAWNFQVRYQHIADVNL